jgi:hypothetical protein
MPSYIPPQGERKKGYGIFPPQGVTVLPPAPPPPPPPELYINILDSAIGSELIDIFNVLFGVEQNLLVTELSTKSFDVEQNVLVAELSTQSLVIEDNIIVTEVVFPT